MRCPRYSCANDSGIDNRAKRNKRGDRVSRFFVRIRRNPPNGESNKSRSPFENPKRRATGPPLLPVALFATFVSYEQKSGLLYPLGLNIGKRFLAYYLLESIYQRLRFQSGYRSLNLGPLYLMKFFVTKFFGASTRYNELDGTRAFSRRNLARIVIESYESMWPFNQRFHSTNV